MALTDLTIIRRSLTARLFSTLTTIATVAVAVGLMLVLLAMRDSGRKAFERGAGNLHVLVSADSSPLVSILNSVFYANAPQRAIPMTQYQKLFPRAADGAGFTDRRLDFALPVQQGDSFRGFPTMATVPEFFTRFQPSVGEPFALATGAFPTGDFDVLLGAEVARATGFAVGKQLFVTHGYTSRRGHAPARGDTPDGGAAKPGHHHHHGDEKEDPNKPWRPTPAEGADEDIHADFPFTVVGILKPTGSAHDRAVFIHLHATWLMHADEKRHEASPSADEPTVENLQESEKLITGVYVGVKTREGSDVSVAVGPIFAALRSDPTLTVALPGQEIRKLFEIVGNVDRIIIAIAFAVLVSSGIAILLALYNSMEQRRRQIAVLRVLGASRLRVFALILTESAIIGLAGAAAGTLVGFVAIQTVEGKLREKLGLVIDAQLDPQIVIPVLAGTVLLAALAGIIPSLMAYGTSVSRALRPL